MGFDPTYMGKTAPALGGIGDHGSVTVTSTAGRAASSATVFNYNIVFTNTDTNPSNIIYFGLSDVTGPGTATTCGGAILPGTSVVVPPGDLSTYYFIAPSGSPVMTWVGFNTANPS